MIDHDPWRKNEIFKLEVIKCDYIKSIPSTLDEIKCIHLLTQKVFLLNAESHNQHSPTSVIKAMLVM